MPVWELIGFDTSTFGEDSVRYRTYTTSARRAEEFKQIGRIQFTDSGHGIVFDSRTHHGRRLPERRGAEEHVRRELARIREANLTHDARRRRGSKRDRVLINLALELAAHFLEQGGDLPAPRELDLDMARRMRELLARRQGA